MARVKQPIVQVCTSLYRKRSLRTPEILVNEAVGKTVSETFITVGNYGEKKCCWLHMIFNDQTRVTVPLLSVSWSTQKLWPKEKR